MNFRGIPYLFFTFALFACQSSKKSVEPSSFQALPSPSGYQQEIMEPLTFKGLNRYPHVSQDHLTVIYVSSSREKHEHQQVYSLDLKSKIEKRMTFQNGRLSHPQFIAKSNFYTYQSTTDSDKEQSFLYLKKNKELGPSKSVNQDLLDPATLLPIDTFDIYMSDGAGNQIQRLTTQSAFDGGLTFLDSEQFVFSAEHKRSIGLRKGRLQNQRVQLQNLSLLADLKEWHSLYPSIHPLEPKWAWLQLHKTENKMRLVLGNPQGRPLLFFEPPQMSLFTKTQWHPSGSYLLFSSNLDDINNFELYVFDFSENCLKRLTYWSSQEIDPTWSPDGSQIYLASNAQNSFQIFKIQFSPPLTCTHPQNGDMIFK